MSGLRDMLASERSTWCLMLLCVVLIFVAWKIVDGSTALSFLMQVTAVLLATKTATGYIESKTPPKE